MVYRSICLPPCMRPSWQSPQSLCCYPGAMPHALHYKGLPKGALRWVTLHPGDLNLIHMALAMHENLNRSLGFKPCRRLGPNAVLLVVVWPRCYNLLRLRFLIFPTLTCSFYLQQDHLAMLHSDIIANVTGQVHLGYKGYSA